MARDMRGSNLVIGSPVMLMGCIVSGIGPLQEDGTADVVVATKDFPSITFTVNSSRLGALNETEAIAETETKPASETETETGATPQTENAMGTDVPDPGTNVAEPQSGTAEPGEAGGIASGQSSSDALGG